MAKVGFDCSIPPGSRTACSIDVDACMNPQLTLQRSMDFSEPLKLDNCVNVVQKREQLFRLETVWRSNTCCISQGHGCFSVVIRVADSSAGRA